MTVKRFNKLLIQYKYSQKAVRALYDTFYPLIVLHINCKFGGGVDGRDVAQQFFVDLFKLSLRERIRYPTTWIYKVVDNIALGVIRKNKKRMTAEKLKAMSEYVHISQGASETLKCLSAPEQSVIYLRYWERYKLKEIAELLGKKYEAVLYLHKTAKIKLRKEKQKELLQCKST